MIISKKIRAMRIDLGITQGELASRLGISDSAVSRYELGAPIPGPIRLLLKPLFEEADHMHGGDSLQSQVAELGDGADLVMPQRVRRHKAPDAGEAVNGDL